MQADTTEKRTDSTRLETFSDAVFAFSATLLVVSLEVPESFPDLIDDLRGFVAFGLRFAALLMLWSVHHAYFRRYPLADGLNIILNACLLFVILFYVYPLKFMSEGLVSTIMGDPANMGMRSVDDLALMFILYSAGFVAIFFFVALMYWHAYHKSAHLKLTLIQKKEAAFFTRHYMILAGVGVLSIITAILKIGIHFGGPGHIYMILGPLCYWHARRHANAIATLEAH